MLKNTFFAKEPGFLKAIYGIGFLGILYNIYLLIFTNNDSDPIIRIFSSVTFTILIFRKLFKDQKKTNSSF